MPLESELAPGARTPCPHCDRETRTVGRGACGDCLKAKIPGGQPVLRPEEPRTEKLLDVDVSGWFELDPLRWLMVVVGAVGALAWIVSRLVF